MQNSQTESLCNTNCHLLVSVSGYLMLHGGIYYIQNRSHTYPIMWLSFYPQMVYPTICAFVFSLALSPSFVYPYFTCDFLSFLFIL